MEKAGEPKIAGETGGDGSKDLVVCVLHRACLKGVISTQIATAPPNSPWAMISWWNPAPSWTRSPYICSVLAVVSTEANPRPFISYLVYLSHLGRISDGILITRHPEAAPSLRISGHKCEVAEVGITLQGGFRTTREYLF